MNGLRKPFRKNSDPKNQKNSKNQSEIAACEQKTTSEKANFLFKQQKNFTRQNHSFFRSTFFFRRDQNHYSNLTSKIKKMCEQILTKT